MADFQTADELVDEALAVGVEVDQATQVMKTVADETAASDQIAETLASLQAVIERNATQLQRVDTELKEKRQMLKNIFDNDATLHAAEEEAAAVTQKHKERKAQIQNDPQSVSLKLQIAEINQNKKEIQEALSSHLINYHQLTGSTSFDTSDGDQWDFNIWAKVKIKK